MRKSKRARVRKRTGRISARPTHNFGKVLAGVASLTVSALTKLSAHSAHTGASQADICEELVRQFGDTLRDVQMVGPGTVKAPRQIRLTPEATRTARAAMKRCGLRTISPVIESLIQRHVREIALTSPGKAMSA